MASIKKDFSSLSPKILYPYSAGDSDGTLRIFYDYVIPELKSQQLLPFYQTIVSPLYRYLLKSEIYGYKMSRKKVNEIDDKISFFIKKQEETLRDFAGSSTFNPDSPIELRKVLFEVLRLKPGKKKTKTGLYSTDKSSLLEIQEKNKHPFLQILLDSRALKKLRSTYLRGFIQKADRNDYVHTTFDLKGSVTGRVTSNNPALTTIPRDTEYRLSDKEKVLISIRDLFICEDDEIQTYADYSGVELRVLAVLSMDKLLLRVFEENEDPHDQTAQIIFDNEYVQQQDAKCLVSSDKEDPCGKCKGCVKIALRATQRTEAKRVNFGIVFGGSPEALAKILNKPVQVVEKIYNRFMEKYFGLQNYMHSIPLIAYEEKQIISPYGRIRHFQDFDMHNSFYRGRVARQAINCLPQTTAAIMMQETFVKICKKLLKYKLKTWPRNIIYDALITVGPYKEHRDVRDIFVEVMSRKVSVLENRRFSFAWGQGSTWALAEKDSKHHEVNLSLKKS